MDAKPEIAEMREKESVLGQLPVYRLYADGASQAIRKNKRRLGSWAFRLEEEGGSVVEACGYERYLFNTRAELLAVVKGLEYINKPARVIVYTDYQGFLDGLARLETWKARDWRKSANGIKKVEDADLWMRVYELSRIMQITVQKVSRAMPNANHQRCHRLANLVLRKGRKEWNLARKNARNNPDSINIAGPTAWSSPVVPNVCVL